MLLSQYIEEVGDERAAKVLGVKKRTVAAYRRRERRPRPTLAKEFVKKLKGKVSFDEMYDHKSTRNGHQ